MVTNTGSVPAGPVKITDTLPAGVNVLSVDLFWAEDSPRVKVPKVSPVLESSAGWEMFPENREGESTSWCVTESSPAKVTCEFPPEAGMLRPDQRLQMDVYVTVEESAGDAVNQSTVSESGTLVASESQSDTVSEGMPGFGLTGFDAELANAGGVSDTQAGDHPYEVASRFDLNTAIQVTTENKLETAAVGQARDVVVDLPLGVLGSAVATAKCTFAELESKRPQPCPLDTLVGHVSSEPHGKVSVNGGVYAMVPERGVVAEFGFIDLLHNTHVILATLAPTPAGYVVRAVAHEVPQVPLTAVITRLFGDPGVKAEETQEIDQETVTAMPKSAMFTNSSDCSGEPLETSIFVDSWEHPGAFYPDGSPDIEGPGWSSATVSAPAVSGCEQLRFSPDLFTATPDSTTPDTATGLSLDMGISQDEAPGSLASPPVRDARVTLPAGLIANPAAAAGLEGCSVAEIGWLGHSPSELENFNEEQPSCPNASKVGSVEVISPLLEAPVIGSLYIARQDKNPFGSVLAGYLVIDDPTTGLLVKVPGKLSFNETTGQITGEFAEAPQAPFSELKLRFFGGSRGLLATPESCGTYTTSGVLTPWSGPASGAPAEVASSFQVNSCPQPFTPAFSAGTTSPQAASYSPFILNLSRQDSEQELSGVTVNLPAGLTAKIAGVAKCPEADIQAAAANPSGRSEEANPSCPASSEVGTVTASSGAGNEPLVNSGRAYLTGPYKGAPLGLAVIVPAVAGPFDLGNVVVRTALYINPTDAHVTAVSDQLPTIVKAQNTSGSETDGFPVRMKSITINLNRNGYVLNPTSCQPTSINATLTSTSGASSNTSSRFQVGGCQELAFNPSFNVSTQGHASKAAGASLHVHVTTTPGQANIAKVKVDLPKQLPSWLPTLQKACLDATFTANPAACPAGSLVGTATATTPLIAAPFTGPAYLVSHGGAAFPDLEIVLQSEDITLILDGHTNIKHGITTSYFETLPDAPVTNFELTLPMGTNHVLATNIPEKLNHNLCGQTLNMPTLITAQNGTTLKKTTKITITGCTTKHKTNNKKHKNKKR
jgi:hypothetical protein